MLSSAVEWAPAEAFVLITGGHARRAAAGAARAGWERRVLRRLPDRGWHPAGPQAR